MKTWWFLGSKRTTDEGITADVETLCNADFGSVGEGGALWLDYRTYKNKKKQIVPCHRCLIAFFIVFLQLDCQT